MPEEQRARNRATERAFPPSRSPHVHSHFFVTKMFEFLCTLPRVRRNEQRRSANENRKSNEDAGTVLSRKLDVLQPMERWNLKHPTNTELLNLAKDTLPEKKSHPGNQWWSKHFFLFFFSYKHWQKLFTARQREHDVSTTVKLHWMGYSVWSTSSSLSYRVTVPCEIYDIYLQSSKVLKIHLVALICSGIYIYMYVCIKKILAKTFSYSLPSAGSSSTHEEIWGFSVCDWNRFFRQWS